MYNYFDDEADYPKDKATRKFLLTDYFHDSRIRSMKYNYKKEEFVLKLQCCRDWERLGKGSIEEKEKRHGLYPSKHKQRKYYFNSVLVSQMDFLI